MYVYIFVYSKINRVVESSTPRPYIHVLKINRVVESSTSRPYIHVLKINRVVESSTSRPYKLFHNIFPLLAILSQ